ncbi:MAG: hypothetical protein J0I29_11715 [Rhizobiales bacterium]|nr:hypothetical protein [Hyphomicrobiales bacterium]
MVRWLDVAVVLIVVGFKSAIGVKLLAAIPAHSHALAIGECVEIYVLAVGSLMKGKQQARPAKTAEVVFSGKPFIVVATAGIFRRKFRSTRRTLFFPA